MGHRSHSSAARSDDANYHGAKPIFISGWWRGLKTSQRWLLSAFIAFHATGVFLFCLSITTDVYFEHSLQLIGLRPVGFPDQLVQYNVSMKNGVGFWSNTAKRKLSDSVLAIQSDAIKKLIYSHVAVARELWEYCAHRAHRATACWQTAFVLLSASLIGLYSSYAVGFLNRKLMVQVSVGSTFMMLASFTLLYAASLEYNNCIVQQQIRYYSEYDFQFVAYKGRYFLPSFVANYPPMVGVLMAYALGFFPMIGVGIALLVKFGDNL